jgi:O-antigen/teichoic acid export membrane protein
VPFYVEQPRPARRLVIPRLPSEAATVASRIFAKALSFGFVVIVARAFSPTGFAAYSYLVALIFTFMVLTEIGVVAIAGREVARGDLDPAAAYRAALLPVGLAGLAGGVLLMGFGLAAPGPATSVGLLALAAASVTPIAIFALQSELIRCQGRLGLEATLNVISALLLVGLAYGSIRAELGLAGVLAAFPLGSLVMVAAGHAALPWSRGRPRTGLVRALLRAGIIIGVAGTALTLMSRVSLIAVSNAVSAGAAAQFAVAQRVFEFQLIICSTLGFALLPRFGRMFGDDARHAWRTSRRVLLAVGLIAVAVAAAAAAIVPWVVPAVFGQRYDDAVPAAQLLIAGLPAIAVFMLGWQILTAGRLEHDVLRAAVVGLVLALLGAACVLVTKSTIMAAAACDIAFAASGALCLVSAARGGRAAAAAPAGRAQTPTAGAGSPGTPEA